MRESSDLDNTSSDEELDDLIEKKDFLLSAKRLIKSSKKSDQRFINIFNVIKAPLSKTIADNEAVSSL